MTVFSRARAAPRWLWVVFLVATAAWAVARTVRVARFMWSPANYASGVTQFKRDRHNCTSAYFVTARGIRLGVDPYVWPFGAPAPPPIAIALPEPLDQCLLPASTPPPALVVVPLITPLDETHFPQFRWRWFVAMALACTALLLCGALWLKDELPMLPWLVPLVCGSFPWLYNLQLGQLTMVGAVLNFAAVAAIATRRERIGGILLGAATMTLIFPGIIAIPLAMRRRWRPLVWAAGLMLALTLVSIAVFGWHVHASYALTQVPKMLAGRDVAGDAFRTRFGVWELFMRMKAAGLPLGDGAPVTAAAIYSVFVLGLTVAVGVRGMRRPQGQATTPLEDALALGSLLALVLLSRISSTSYGTILGIVVGAVLLAALTPRLADAGPGRAILWVAVVAAFAWLTFAVLDLGDPGHDAPRILRGALFTVTTLFLGLVGVLWRPSVARDARP